MISKNKNQFLKERRKLENRRARFETVIDAPEKLMLELTNICNHRCVFCANVRMTRPKGCIDLVLAKRLLAEAADMGVKELSLVATGEPFASPDIGTVIRLAKEYGFTYVYVTTNGGLATVEKLKNAIETGLDSLKFSFNAGTRETYLRIHGRDDFDKVARRIKEIARYRQESKRDFLLGISCVLTKINREEKSLVEELFAGIVDDIMFVDEGAQAGYQAADDNTKAMKQKCVMPFTTANVTYEGYLTLCCVDFQNYLAVADLKDMSLAEGWNSEMMQKARKMLIEQKTEGTLCHRCITGRSTAAQPLMPELATVDANIFSLGNDPS